MQYDTKLEDGNTYELRCGGIADGALWVVVVVVVLFVRDFQTRFDVLVLLRDDVLALALPFARNLWAVGSVCSDSAAIWIMRDTVSVRVVADAHRGELRCPPAERDELDNEDQEDANHSDGERIGLVNCKFQHCESMAMKWTYVVLPTYGET